MLILSILGSLTTTAIHTTGPLAIPQRSGSESNTRSGASESRGPVPDSETLRFNKGEGRFIGLNCIPIEF